MWERRERKREEMTDFIWGSVLGLNNGSLVCSFATENAELLCCVSISR